MKKKAIQVIQTTTYTYTPNLDGDFYQENEILTLEDAALADQKDIDLGKLTVDELLGINDTCVVTRDWKVIELDD